MDPINVAIGVAAILYGFFTLVARQLRPTMFGKLGPMKEMWGPRTGVAIHVIGYTVMPIVFGAFLLWLEFSGGSLL